MFNNLGQGIQQMPDAFAGNVDNSVKLFVFTPRIHGNICLRPSMFNFNPGVVDELLAAQSAKLATAAFGRPGTTNLTRSIKPDAQGIPIDSSIFDSMWSFILIFDSTGNAMRTSMVGAPQRRMILTGYFVDEPVATQTLYSSRPILNPDAIMVFTHESLAVITKHLQQRSQDSVSIAANNDFVPQMTDSFVQSTDLALVDAGSIAKSTIVDENGDDRIVLNDNNMIGCVDGESPVLGACTKTPRQQMVQIASAIDSAADAAVHVGDHYSGFDTGPNIVGSDPFAVFINQIHSSIGLRNAPTTITSTLNGAIPIPLGVLSSNFPNLMVYPIKIPSTPCYEVGDQNEMNIHNTFSSMVSSTVSAYCADLGISGIGFRYDSFSAGTFGQGGGNWQMLRVAAMLGDATTEDRLARSCNQFKTGMENDLFPVLKSFGGEFSLIVDYDMIGSTVIDLHFLDYDDSFGLYEAHNRLGGIISPAVGSTNTLNTNREQFDQLVTLASHNVVGRIPMTNNERQPYHQPANHGLGIKPSIM